MTRKDYIAIAKAFAEMQPSPSDYGHDGDIKYSGAYSEWIGLRDKVSKVLSADNPRFDRERFYCACEGCAK